MLESLPNRRIDSFPTPEIDNINLPQFLDLVSQNIPDLDANVKSIREFTRFADQLINTDSMKRNLRDLGASAAYAGLFASMYLYLEWINPTEEISSNVALITTLIMSSGIVSGMAVTKAREQDLWNIRNDFHQAMIDNVWQQLSLDEQKDLHAQISIAKNYSK